VNLDGPVLKDVCSAVSRCWLEIFSTAVFYTSVRFSFNFRKLAETRISGVPSGNMNF